MFELVCRAGSDGLIVEVVGECTDAAKPALKGCLLAAADCGERQVAVAFGETASASSEVVASVLAEVRPLLARRGTRLLVAERQSV